MTKHKFLFIGIVLLLISTGIVFAQSSTNYQIHRFTFMSGGVSDSAHYKVNAVIGQPATGTSTSSNHVVTAGFLYRPSTLNYKVNLPIVIQP